MTMKAGTGFPLVPIFFLEMLQYDIILHPSIFLGLFDKLTAPIWTIKKAIPLLPLSYYLSFSRYNACGAKCPFIFSLPIRSNGVLCEMVGVDSIQSIAKAFMSNDTSAVMG